MASKQHYLPLPYFAKDARFKNGIEEILIQDIILASNITAKDDNGNDVVGVELWFDEHEAHRVTTYIVDQANIDVFLATVTAQVNPDTHELKKYTSCTQIDMRDITTKDIVLNEARISRKWYDGNNDVTLLYVKTGHQYDTKVFTVEGDQSGGQGPFYDFY